MQPSEPLGFLAHLREIVAEAGADPGLLADLRGVRQDRIDDA